MAPERIANKPKATLMLIVAVLGGLLNCLASMVNMSVGSPLFLDSIATAACGLLFGPWLGLLCGLSTHAFLVILHGGVLEWAYFLPCSLATGLIAGLFGRKRPAVSLLRVLLCIVSIALANAVIAAPIATLAYGGITVHASDYLVAGLILAGQSILSAAFLARIPINLIDKGIAVAVAFLLYSRPAISAWFGLPRPVREQSAGD
jgi:energy-coupling factor transport system substrate-specific component